MDLERKDLEWLLCYFWLARAMLIIDITSSVWGVVRLSLHISRGTLHCRLFNDSWTQTYIVFLHVLRTFSLPFLRVYASSNASFHFFHISFLFYCSLPSAHLCALLSLHASLLHLRAKKLFNRDWGNWNFSIECWHVVIIMSCLNFGFPWKWWQR